MKIKDIVNREIVNLTNCEHEPIHVPGSIQPHGFLMAFKKADNKIDFCSGNIFEHTGIRYEQVLSKTIDQILGKDQTKRIEDYLQKQVKNFTAPLSLEVNNHLFSATIHLSGGTYVLEFEPTGSITPDSTTLYNQTRQFVTNLEKASSLQELCQNVADETRNLTGYDRVMIYRFDKDYNGEVFAESKREDIESFFGLHYPHTDIPVQARELYKKNLLRLIVDVNYQPVPLYTVDDQTEKNLDLGQAALRSVSPIHVQYLHNMGVGATLTISLMHQDDLWGLIACHHYSPKYISNFTRISALLQGHFLTSQINVRQVAEQYGIAQKVNAELEKILSRTFSLHRNSFKNLTEQKELLTLCNAAGAAILIDDVIYKSGLVPPDDEIQKLINWANTYSRHGVFCTSKLVDFYPEAKKINESAAGILFHSLSSIQNNGIIWFRPETLKEVNWAGDPQKAIIKDEKGLFPRKSFELWKEIIKYQSNEWEEPEIAAASNFAHSLQKQIHLLFLSEEENKYRALSEKLKEANAELENVNWISTHDLKEPLRKIQVFASRILDRDSQGLSESVINSLRRMNESANRMQTLIADIMTYSRLKNASDSFKDVNLNELIEHILNDLKEDIQEKQAQVTVESLPVVSGISFLLNQLFVNLIRNALKFTNKNVPPVIHISCVRKEVEPKISYLPVEEYYKIKIKDNGIGFEEKYKTSIFNVFTRLHTSSEYSGSGVGLALCKKIVQNHHGFITANSSPGEGAEFIIHLPVSKL